MKYFILIILSLFLISCSPLAPEKVGQICWSDVQGTTWYLDEQLNIYQSCRLEYTFAKDTLYLVKIYFDNTTNEIESYKYMKGKVFNKRYKEDSDGDIDLFFTWARKHYADPKFTVPVESYNIIDDWFLYKIDDEDHLLMGIVNPIQNSYQCYFWEHTRKK